MNHIADHAASFAMGQATCKLVPHQECYFNQPDNIKCPLGTYFEIVIGELTCDKNTSNQSEMSLMMNLSFTGNTLPNKEQQHMPFPSAK
jgi:hypothetical protein